MIISKITALTLFVAEIWIFSLCFAIMLALNAIASFAPIEDWLRILLIVIGVLPALVLCHFVLKIEQIAGYYECLSVRIDTVPSIEVCFLQCIRERPDI